METDLRRGVYTRRINNFSIERGVSAAADDHVRNVRRLLPRLHDDRGRG